MFCLSRNRSLYIYVIHMHMYFLSKTYIINLRYVLFFFHFWNTLNFVSVPWTYNSRFCCFLLKLRCIIFLTFLKLLKKFMKIRYGFQTKFKVFQKWKNQLWSIDYNTPPIPFNLILNFFPILYLRFNISFNVNNPCLFFLSLHNLFININCF